MMKTRYPKAFFETFVDDPMGFTRNTGFKVFTHLCGVRGLAKIEGDALHLLAVDATQPGTGQFSALLADAKQAFASITVHEVRSAHLTRILASKGFDPDTPQRWIWKRPQPSLP